MALFSSCRCLFFQIIFNHEFFNSYIPVCCSLVSSEYITQNRNLTYQIFMVKELFRSNNKGKSCESSGGRRETNYQVPKGGLNEAGTLIFAKF